MLFIKSFVKKLFYYYFPSFFYLKNKKQNITFFFNYLLKKNSIYNYNFYQKKIKFFIGDFFSFETFFISKKFEETSLIKIIKYLNNKEHNTCIFDIGSNIGFYSLLFSLNDRATVYSFEPFEKTALIQKKNITINNRKNIILKQLALSSKDNEGSVYYDKIFTLPSNSLNISEKSEFTRNQNFNQKVDISSLETFCIKNKIEKVDFIKIDVEGEEFKIFNDIDNFLNKFKPIIYLEVHTTYSEAEKSYVYDKTFFDPLKKFNMYNYDVYLMKDLKEIWKNDDQYKKTNEIFKKENFFNKITFGEERIFNDIKKLNNYKVLAINKNSDFKFDIDEI